MPYAACRVFAKVGARNIYSAARHPTKAGFDRHMDILSAIAPDAHEKLDDIPHETWAHYASRKNVCCDQVTSNPAESSNSMLGPVSVWLRCMVR